MWLPMCAGIWLTTSVVLSMSCKLHMHAAWRNALCMWHAHTVAVTTNLEKWLEAAEELNNHQRNVQAQAVLMLINIARSLAVIADRLEEPWDNRTT